MHYVLWTPDIRNFVQSGRKTWREWALALRCFFFNSLPEDGIQVPKHVADSL